MFVIPVLISIFDSARFHSSPRLYRFVSKKIMVRRQKIENHREPKHRYSIETKRSGIVTWRNCNAPMSIASMTVEPRMTLNCVEDQPIPTNRPMRTTLWSENAAGTTKSPVVEKEFSPRLMMVPPEVIVVYRSSFHVPDVRVLTL